jgi:bifunctional non-homologous end joining protein LigD
MQESISLYYKDAKSDKEYHLQLVEMAGGWVVNYQNGKRGGTLTDKTFTATPVEYEVAKKTYDKKVKDKVGDGYTPDDTAKAFVSTSLEERFTGIVPQLLNVISLAEAEALLSDPDWILEEKHDGHRRMLRHESATVTFSINKKGLAVGMPQEIADAFAPLAAFAPLTVDGEMIGSKFIIFDVVEMHGNDQRALPLERRLQKRDELAVALLTANGKDSAVGVTYTAKSESEKRIHWDWLKANNTEGGVFKRLDSQYVPGRPNSGGNQLKYQFRKHATVIVEKPHATKRSVSVYTLDEAGKKVKRGNVTIPTNWDIPGAEDLVEVEYLYAYEGGSIYQPVYRGPRNDVDRAECLCSKLHFKAPVKRTNDQFEDEDEEDAVAA